MNDDGLKQAASQFRSHFDCANDPCIELSEVDGRYYFCDRSEVDGEIVVDRNGMDAYLSDRRPEDYSNEDFAKILRDLVESN